MWIANVFTIFPEAFPGALGVSLAGKALHQQKWQLNLIDLKSFPAKNDRIDAPPIGGGAGMLLSPITFQKAFATLSDSAQNMRNIYLSPRGRNVNQRDIKDMSLSSGINILCGRYEGVDQRIINHYKMDEISIGDFILLGGESAAQVIIEACVRLLPNVLGNHESAQNESFQNNLLEYNQYTHTTTFLNQSVPVVLFSGNHQKIAQYRSNESKIITKTRRPELWAKYVASELRNNRS